MRLKGSYMEEADSMMLFELGLLWSTSGMEGSRTRS